jgi:hypothetical protein
MEYSSPPFCWNHRKTDEADIYFVSNQELETRSVDVAFRVMGKQPELWHPEAGSIAISRIGVKDGRRAFLRFEPAIISLCSASGESRLRSDEQQAGRPTAGWQVAGTEFRVYGNWEDQYSWA